MIETVTWESLQAEEDHRLISRIRTRAFTPPQIDRFIAVEKALRQKGRLTRRERWMLGEIEWYWSYLQRQFEAATGPQPRRV